MTSDADKIDEHRPEVPECKDRWVVQVYMCVNIDPEEFDWWIEEDFDDEESARAWAKSTRKPFRVFRIPGTRRAEYMKERAELIENALRILRRALALNPDSLMEIPGLTATMDELDTLDAEIEKFDKEG